MDSTKHALLERCSQSIGERLGLHFPPERLADLDRGLAKLAQELKFPSLEDCLRWLLSSPLSQHQVELLAAPSVISSLAPDEVLTPISNMPEQEWLLLGTPVFQVACATDRSPVPIVAPDPRWMGLHKLWLSKMPERNKLKATKDAKQGNALLSAVRSFMQARILNFIAKAKFLQ